MHIFQMEEALLEIINKYRLPYLDNFLLFANYFIYVYLIILIIYFFKRRKRSETTHLCVNSLFGGVIVFSLKYLINRPRPTINPLIKKIDPSFPSSHSFFSFMCLRFIPKKAPWKLKILIYLYLVFIVPLSLLYMCIHYPTDILGGILLGLSIPSIMNEERSSFILKLVVRIIGAVRRLITKIFDWISSKFVERVLGEFRWSEEKEEQNTKKERKTKSLKG